MKNGTIIISLALLLSGCAGDQKDFDATGSFEATEVILSSEAAGRILSLDVSEGDTVAAGQQLGTIDTVQLYLTKMQLLDNIRSVRSNRPDVAKQIAALKEQIAKQQVEKARVANLLKSNAATQKQLDDIESNIAVLQKQLAAQESTLQKNTGSIDAQSSALEIQVAQIEDNLQKSTVTSPLQGTVLAKYAEAGELASIGRPLLKVADIKNMYLRAYLTSGQLSDVKIGDRVRVFADFGGGKRREYPGTVTWISDKSEFTPKSIQTKDDRENLVYATKIVIENDGYAKIGMYGEVKFQ